MQANIKNEPLCFNPDPLDGNTPRYNVRIFGTRPGYNTKGREMKTPANPLRIRRNVTTPKADEKIEIYTDGSSLLNGWENSTAGIGNWHREDSMRNVALKLSGPAQTNQRAELAAILAALQFNSSDDNLLIYSDSLTSLTTICHKLQRYEDIGWNKVKNSDILMQITEELRTRQGTCEFQWVKAHENNEGNNMADELANQGRIGDDYFMLGESNSANSRAIHDGARLCALEMKDIYSILTGRLTDSKGEIKRAERIEEAKEMTEIETGLRPTTESIVERIWRLPTYPRARDLIWSITVGRIKLGKYWQHIPDLEARAYCTACEENEATEILEDETHLWIGCPYNGQKEAWEAAKDIWKRVSEKEWPALSMGLLRGIGAIELKDENGKPLMTSDSKKLKILITAAIWAIWKTRNRRSISNIHTDPEDSIKELLNILKDLSKKLANKTSLYTREANKSHKKSQTPWNDIAAAIEEWEQSNNEP